MIAVIENSGMYDTASQRLRRAKATRALTNTCCETS